MTGRGGCSKGNQKARESGPGGKVRKLPERESQSAENSPGPSECVGHRKIHVAAFVGQVAETQMLVVEGVEDVVDTEANRRALPQLVTVRYQAWCNDHSVPRRQCEATAPASRPAGKKQLWPYSI